jgi:hypothetical protein
MTLKSSPSVGGGLMTMIDPQMYRMDADGKPQRSYLRASALEIIDSLDLTNGGFQSASSRFRIFFARGSLIS